MKKHSGLLNYFYSKSADRESIGTFTKKTNFFDLIKKAKDDEKIEKRKNILLTSTVVLVLIGSALIISL